MQKLKASAILESAWLLPAILSAGIALRISGLTESAIWYDEAITFEAGKLPFLSMLEAAKYSFSPPLWGMIAWASMKLFGENEFALRMPALLAGIFSLWLTYGIAGDFNLSRHQKTAVMFFVSLMPYQFAMAQDGRMYTLLTVLYLGAIHFALRDRWIAVTVCAAFLLYTHYTAPFYLAALYTVILINGELNFRRLRNTLASGAVASLSFLPWLPNYLNTLKIASPVNPLSVLDLNLMFYRISFEDTFTPLAYLLYPALTIILLSVSLSALLTAWELFPALRAVGAAASDIKEAARRFIQLIVFALLPLIIMAVWSFVWKNFLYYRLLAALSVPLVIWSVKIFEVNRFAHISGRLLLPLWLVLVFCGILLWTPSEKSGDMRGILEFIDEQWEDGDIVYHMTGTSYLPVSQYTKDKPQYLMDEVQHAWLLPTELQEIFQIPQTRLEGLNAQRVWVFYSQDGLMSPEAKSRAQAYTQNGVLIGVIKGWRFSPIHIYLVDAALLEE